MYFTSICESLLRSLDADPENISLFGFEIDNYKKNNNNNKRCLHEEMDDADDEMDDSMSVNAKRVKLNRPSPIDSDDSLRKVIFVIDEKEYRRIQERSYPLLEELFSLTLQWPVGKVAKMLSNNDSTDKAINHNFCFRNSVFDAPLVNIPAELKSPITRIPRIIIVLMKSLTKPECLETEGVFRLESSPSKCDYYQKAIDNLFQSNGEDQANWLDEVPVNNRTHVLKRYFRKIPGLLVSRALTVLLYELFVAYNESDCFSGMICLVLNCLPLENYKALAMVCLLLNLYSENEQDTKMDDLSLSKQWALNLFDVPETKEEMAFEVTDCVIKLLHLFIKRWECFFICKL